MEQFIDSIEITNIVALVIGLVSLIKAIQFLASGFYAKIDNLIMSNINPINNRLDSIEANLKKIDKEQCKSFLTQNLNSDHELSETERQRVYEVYQHYRELGGNSYIKEAFEKMQDEGKL